jgi:hypothetical protein
MSLGARDDDLPVLEGEVKGQDDEGKQIGKDQADYIPALLLPIVCLPLHDRVRIGMGFTG